MTRPFGETPYTLTNLIVSVFDIAAGTFSDTIIELPDGMMFVAEPESDVDKMKAYGKYTRGLSIPLGCKVTFKAGGIHFPALEALANATVATTGVAGNQIKTVKRPAGGQGMGYFGIMGLSRVDDGSLMVIGHKQVMLNTPPKTEQDGENNKFFNWESEGYSFPFDESNESWLDWTVVYEDPADFTVPADGAAFLAFFTS